MIENQALYEELFALLSKRQEAETLHRQTLSDLALKFRDAVYAQLGFPAETYPRPAAEGESTATPLQEPWVCVYEFADGQIQPMTGSVLNTIREDGSLSFAIGVSLSATLESHPKYHFWAGYSLSMKTPTETPVLGTQSGKPREYRIVNQDFSKAVDDFVSDIKNALDPAGIFNAAKKSECIGFFCSY